MKSDSRIYQGLGVVHYVSFPQLLSGTGPFIETFKIILADDFFDTIEITWIKEERQKLRAIEVIKESGKRIVLAGGPPYAFQQINLSSLDQDVRKKSIELAKQLIDDAYRFGARLHLITGGPDPSPAFRAQAKDCLVNSILELLAYTESQANDYLLTLSMEPVDRAIHRKGLIGPIKEAVEIARKVRDRGGNLFLTIDQSHLAQLGEDPLDAIVNANEFLYHVHLANCVISDPSSPLYGDEHPRFGIPGSVHDLPEVVAFLKILKKQGFFERECPYGDPPIISVEVKPQEGENPEELLEATKNLLFRAFPLVGDLDTPS